MNNATSDNKPTVFSPVNIGIYKPNGISTFWSWFTKRNKEENLQNMMYNKKVGLKLNPEEWNSLNINGLDLQQLQNIAANYDESMQKNMFVLSKDQSVLDKNELLKNKCHLLKNKGFLNKRKRYKKSFISSITMSDKSKENVINSNITCIHTIKSKKSVMNSLSSKISLEVGLKSSNKVNVLVNPLNKNILMKSFHKGLFKSKMKKKVFVPIYVSKKKSMKTNEGEKNINNKNKSDLIANSELSIITSPLIKLKTMEGQRSDSENTTNEINKADFENSVFKTNNPSNRNKESSCHQLTNNGLASHKMYSTSSTKSKQKKIGLESKSKKGTLTSNKFSTTESIKDILNNTEHFLKHHNFITPSNLSEKTLFEANPDTECDVIFKLFEALYPNDISTKKQNLHSITSDLGSDKGEKHESELSVSKSQMDIINNCSDGLKKYLTPQKKNSSCPSSSSAISYTSTAGYLKQLHETIAKKINHICKASNQKTTENKNSVLKKITCENKSSILASKEELNVLTSEIIKKENDREVKKDETNNINSLCSLNKSMVSLKLMKDDDRLQIVENNSDSKSFPLSTRLNSDKLNLKLKENTTSKVFNIQVAKSQPEHQTIAIDSGKGCKILIEQAEVSDTAKPSEDEIKGKEILDSDTKNDPKFSITIFVKNNLNDEGLMKKDTPTNINEMVKPPSFAVKDKQTSAMFKRDTLLTNEQDTTTRWQSREDNVNFNFEKIPPLKFPTPTVTSTFTSLPANSYLNHNSDKIVIEEVAYLNQEQRKVFDRQISNAAKSKAVTQVKTKPVAKTSKDLKYDCTPVRHLSECSLNPQKTSMSIVYNLSNQSSGKTSNNSVKSCTKTPYHLLQCRKFRKEINITNSLETNKEQPRSQGGWVNKTIVKKNEECSLISNTSTYSNPTHNNVDYFVTINQTLTAHDSKNKKQNTQNFFVINDENFKGDSMNAEASSCTKKISYRYHMTLNQDPPQDGLPCDQLTIGDHQTKKDNSSTSIGNLEKRSATLNPKSEETQIIKYGDNINEDITNEINVEETSQLERLNTPDCALVSILEPETPTFCPMDLPKAIITSDDKLNIDLTDQSNVIINSQKEIPVMPECALASISKTDTAKSGTCNLARETTTKDNKPNKNLKKHLNIKSSQSKGLDTSGSTLVSLPVSETPTFCPCILAKINTATSTTVQIQAEIVLEKTSQLGNEIRKMSIICTSCMRKSRTVKTSLQSKSKGNAQDTYKKHCYVTEINMNKNTGSGSVSVNVKNENDSEISNNGNLIRKEPPANKSFRDLLEEVLDIKPQNEITHEERKKKCCYHNCLNMSSSSEDNIFSAITDQNTHSLDVSSNSYCSKKHKAVNEIIKYYFDRNYKYKLENLLQSTTELDFIEKQKSSFFRITPDNHEETEEDNHTSKDTEDRKDNNIKSSLNKNYMNDDKNQKTVIQGEEKLKRTKSYFEEEKTMFDNVQTLYMSKTFDSDLARNNGLAVKPSNSGVKSDSYKRNILTETKENYLENIYHHRSYHFVPKVSPRGRRTVIQGEYQLKRTKSNFEVKKTTVSYVQPSYILKAASTGLLRNNGQPYLAGKPITRGVKNDSYKNYKRNKLTTTKENYLERTSHHRSYHFSPKVSSRGTKTIIQGEDQLKKTKNDFEVKKTTVSYAQPPYILKAPSIGLLRNNKQPYLTGKTTTRGVKNGSYKNYKRTTLTTTKENYLERISHNRSYNYFPQVSLRGSVHSTKYAVMRIN